MSNPLDEEVYGELTAEDPDTVKQGNPGKPQAELGPVGDEADTEATRVAEQGD